MPTDNNLFFVVEADSNDPIETPDLAIHDINNTMWQCTKANRSDLCMISKVELKNITELILEVSCIV
jgi:hypothetical protein